MNKNYVNGRAKEYRIMKQLKEEGYDIVLRSAGSHSPVDIVAFKKPMQGKGWTYGVKKCVCIQSKPKKFSTKKARQIENDLNWLNDEFIVEFKLYSTNERRHNKKHDNK